MKRRQAKKIVWLSLTKQDLRWKKETVRKAYNRRYRFHSKNKSTHAWYAP